MKKSAPYRLRTVLWEITLKCNLNCMHCGSDARKTREEELTTEESLAFCRDLANLGVEKICLIGGEPFLRKDWVTIAEEIQKLGMHWSIISNGQKIEENLPTLQRLNPDTVGISIDGATGETHDYIRGQDGTFERAIQAINLMKRREIPVSVITSVNKINIKELRGIRRLIANRNIAWQIQNCVPMGRFPPELMLSAKEYYAVALFIVSTQSHFKKFKIYVSGAHDFGYFSQYLPSVQIAHWVGCQAGITIIGVQSNGNVKGCLALPDQCMEGNIREASITKIWRNPENFRLNRNRKSFGFQRDTTCSKCSKFRECKGGCQGFSHAVSKKFLNHPHCLLKYELKNFQKPPLFSKLYTSSIFSKLRSSQLKLKYYLSQNLTIG